MYSSQSPRIANQQLKVQELCVHKDQDTNLYVVDGSDVIVFIDEAVDSIKGCMLIDDSASETLAVPAASLVIVDSSDYTLEGDDGDRKAIKLDTVTLATNDVVILKYVLQ